MREIISQYLIPIAAILSIAIIVLLAKVFAGSRERHRLEDENQSLRGRLSDRKMKEANADQVHSYKLVVEDTAADNRRIRKQNEIIRQAMERVQRQSDYIRDFAHRFRHDSVGRFELLRTILQHSTDSINKQEIDRALSQIDFMNESLRLHLAPDMAMHVAHQVEARRERFSLNRRIEVLIDTFRERNPEVSLERPEDDVELWGNWHHMELLISNLVSNAINHGRENGKIQISLSTNGSTALLEVYNDYNPDDEELHEKDADELFQLGVTRKADEGRGYGLYFVNQVAEGYGGSVVFENVETVTRSGLSKSTHKGVKFIVSIPAIPEDVESD